MLDTHLNHERDNSLSHERREEHYLRDVRARVKLARAVASKMPGLAAILRERPDRAARFYARFGITEEQFSQGVPAGDGPRGGSPAPQRWQSVYPGGFSSPQDRHWE